MRPKDTYQVIQNKTISQDTLNMLMILYQPFVGTNGVLLYLTLIAQSSITSYKQNIESLLKTMNALTTLQLEQAIISLEESMLLKTYRKNEGNGDHYVFSLYSPLRKEEFFQSPYFNKKYFQNVGQDLYQEYKSLLQMNEIQLDGFEDISHPIRIKEEENQEIEKVTKFVPTYSYESDDTINFDYQRFLSITSNLVFPTVLRTNENMYLIGKLATLYGLSAEEMRTALDRSVNPIALTLNETMLKQTCARLSKGVANVSDPYTLSPYSFLQSKMHGAKISEGEKSILEYLSLNMQFSNEVINILVEYCLAQCQNRLIQKFVYSVASTWARDNVKTREEAIAHTKQNRNIQYKKPAVKIDMPSYYKEGLSKEDLDTSPADEDAQKRFKEALSKLGGN